MRTRRHNKVILPASSLLLLCAGLFSLGCDQTDQTPASTADASAPIPPTPTVQVQRGSAVVSGNVLFPGTPPVMDEIFNRPCHDDAPPLKEETVVVNPNGTLKNVIVYLEGTPRGWGATEPPARLTQINCQYVPHVLAVQTGQTLIVGSQDEILHNVHYRPSKNKADNFGFTGSGQERDVVFDKPEFVRVRCDIHPWMSAFVGIFDHPFFAVTGDDGTFSITGIPDGTYTLVAWHERYGSLRQSITVQSDQPAQASFTYQPPQEAP